jgi:hypothetical protein
LLTPEAIIKGTAKRWSRKFPDFSLIEYNDLYQIGWNLHLKLLDKLKRKKNIERNMFKYYNGYLYVSLNHEFKRLLKREYIYREYIEINGNKSKEETICTEPKQEIDAMVFEFLEAVSEMSQDFVDLIVKGIPRDLFDICTEHVRILRKKQNGWSENGGMFKINLMNLNKFLHLKEENRKSGEVDKKVDYDSILKVKKFDDKISKLRAKYYSYIKGSV